MGGEWRTWCDRCGQEPHNYDLSSCDVCYKDVCKDCSHNRNGGRVCDACSYREENCYECGGDDDCDRCEKDCSELLCRGCAHWTAGESSLRLCDKHAYECAQCNKEFVRSDLRYCGHGCGCDKLLCEDCGETSAAGDDVLRCDEHIVGTCMSCSDRVREPDELYGCTSCARCVHCTDDEVEVVVCTQCGYSPICTICLDNNYSTGDVCESCLEHARSGRFFELGDRDLVLRYNAYAYKHNYNGAIHPDDAEDLTEELHILTPLPVVAEPDQRVLAGKPNDRLTAWGDITMTKNTDKACYECGYAGPDVVACSAASCSSHACADFTQLCAGSCDECKKVFCAEHVSEYDECECVLCPGCRKPRVRTCKNCSEMYTHFCKGCGNDRFTDSDVLESLYEGKWESSDKCMMCFLDNTKS